MISWCSHKNISHVIDEFVKAVAGKGLSIRDIELLATGFFKGSVDLRQQIAQGNITWGLSRSKESLSQTTDCTAAEQSMLKDLESVQRYMQKVTYRIKGDKLDNDAFRAQAGIIVQEIIKFMVSFKLAMKNI